MTSPAPRLRESIPPGLGHVRRGAVGPGLLFLTYFVCWLLIVVLRWRAIERLLEQSVTFESGAALAFLALFPIGLFLAAHWSLRRFVDPPPREGMGTWALAWRAFKKKPRGMAGLMLLGFIYMVAFLCPVLADYGKSETPSRDTPVSQFLPPGGRVSVFGDTRRGEAYARRFLTVDAALAEARRDLDRIQRELDAHVAEPPAEDATEAFERQKEWLESKIDALGTDRIPGLERDAERGGGLVLFRVYEKDVDWWKIKTVRWKHLGEPRRGWTRDPRSVRTMSVGGHDIPYRVDTHPLGTDDLGRDLLSRIIYGSRISLTVGFAAMAVAITLGTFFGVIAGFFGGFTDGLVMRFVDVLLAFPRLLLLLLIITVYEGAGIWVIVLILGATGWMGVSRLVRAEVLRLKELDFVAAARVMGLSQARIMLRHLIPNAMAPIIVAGTLMVGTTILVETALSFLGMGVEPHIPTWGNIVESGSHSLDHAWWIATFPGVAIVFTVVCFNLAGDALRDALDPRQRF